MMIEADDHHPPANIAKMAEGTPLNDTDRVAWLDALTASIRTSDAPLAWLACSALSHYVQTRLREETTGAVRFVLLDAPKEILRERVAGRSDHYMPASLLDSQVDALNAPADAVHVDATQPIDGIQRAILEALGPSLREQADQNDDRKAD